MHCQYGANNILMWPNLKVCFEFFLDLLFATALQHHAQEAHWYYDNTHERDEISLDENELWFQYYSDYPMRDRTKSSKFWPVDEASCYQMCD